MWVTTGGNNDVIQRQAIPKDTRRNGLLTEKSTFGLYYKSFAIVIYDRNDSGQNYKNTITIIIYDQSLS